MISPTGQRAIQDALATGNAILKFISANDVDLTGAHQYGFYLPKAVREMYTDMPSTKGVNDERAVRVQWQDGRVTNSKVKWYGEAKSEYRLTGFGRDFPFRTFDNVGDVLVLIPKSLTEFNCYVLDEDDDIDEIQSALRVDLVERWVAYRAGRELLEEAPEACIERHFREWMKPLEAFPAGHDFSDETRAAVEACHAKFAGMTPDVKLIELIEKEYRLFRMVERQLCQPLIQRIFKDMDEFLEIAQSITQRRKSRAGRALENHVGRLLRDAQIEFETRPRIDGKVEPDILIPGKDEYNNPNFPVENLYVVGVKTTCKDRWRQVTKEGRRIPRKHVLTVQPGVSADQLNEMYEENVTLVVPQSLHKEFPKGTKTTILTVEQFIGDVKARQQGGTVSNGLFN